MIKRNSISARSFLIWSVSISFLLFQFFLQLSSGLVIGALIKDQPLSASEIGLLSSSFYYIYTALQIPVGLLFDRYNTRFLLAFNALICAGGCLLFAKSQSFWLLVVARLIIGSGSAFAFVGLAQILRQYFPIKHYAFFMGLSETLGFSVTVLAMISMGVFLESMGWRQFIELSSFIGFMISILCLVCIPNNKPVLKVNINLKAQLFSMFRNKLVWFNGLFVGLEFSVITVFAAMWAVPFLELKFACDLKTAGILTSMTFLGAALSCPLFGFLSIRLQHRKPLIHLSCLSTAAFMIIVLLCPISNLLVIGLLMFLIGLCCGAYMLAFTIANELASADTLSTCTGFTNTLGMLSAPLFQPLIGFLLDKLSGNPGHYTVQDYQWALCVIPVALIGASFCSKFLPEKAS